MSRGCCGESCGCKLTEGAGVTITGSGTPSDPFVINAAGNLGVSDSTSINLDLSGDGSSGDPFVLTATFASTSKLDMLGDVNAPAPNNGYVLSWNGTAWVPAPPTTAAAGTIQTDTSLSGDGSSGNHLGVRHASSGGTETSSTGIKLTDSTLNELIRHFPDSTTRGAATLAPVVNTLSMLDNAPGIVDYWDGSEWAPLAAIQTVTSVAAGTAGLELVNLSGDYDGRPVHVIVKNINVTTDAGGAFNVLSTGDLAGYAGVLSCHIQEVGTPAWKALIVNTTGQVGAVAYQLSNGAVLANATVVATVTAYVY